jgi:hypothetical protein
MRFGAIGRWCGVGGVVLATLGSGGPAGAQPLQRDLGSFFLLALRSASLKDLMLPDSCNVGTSCASPNPNSSCGTLSLDRTLFGDGSQIAADAVKFTKPGADVFQVFRNNGSPLDNVAVRQPPIVGFQTPLIAGSCEPGCTPKPAVIERMCSFPDPFPACTAGKDVVVQPSGDCSIGDTTPGNKRCDLPAGSYGVLDVRNDARVILGSGTFNFCEVKIGKGAEMLATTALILIPPGPDSAFRVNNGSTVGFECGDITVLLKGPGVISLGKQSRITARICAPEANISLGHSNRLVGQFVGDTIVADVGNEGRCCGRCVCFDDFTPKMAKVGDTITLTSHCSLDSTTRVRICGIEAPITSKSSNNLTVSVPAGASGSCKIEVDSVPGTFTGNMILSVS